MTWVRVPKPSAAEPTLLSAVQSVRRSMPPEYGSASSDRVPDPVKRDSIVLAHGLIPDLLHGFFGAYNALMSPELPLSRREHELIAVVVSKLNDCFY